MKRNYIILISFLLSIVLGACSDDDEMQINLPKPSHLMGPENNTVIALDPDNNASSTFSWSSLPDNGLVGEVTYQVLFDKDGTLFEMPVMALKSDNNGKDTVLTILHSELDEIAGLAGIPGKKSGVLKWAVEAIVDQDTITSVAGSVTVNRPTSLGDIPEMLYLTGSAIDGGEMAFHKSSAGEFDIITSLQNGEFHIQSATSGNFSSYYLEGGELFRGETPMVSDGEKVVLIKVSFNNAEGDVYTINAFEMILVANGETMAQLDYVGDQTFEAKNVPISFLNPGDPNAPDWLGWVEERYKFRVKTDKGDLIYGSYMDASMFGSNVPGLTPTDQRPDGAQPAYYFNIYTVDPDDYWAGCYKLGSATDGNKVNVTVYFKSDAQYYHQVELAN